MVLVIPLILMVLEITNTKTNSDVKMVPYADDFSAAVFIFQFRVSNIGGIHCEN